jgi:hypothetical protein
MLDRLGRGDNDRVVIAVAHDDLVRRYLVDPAHPRTGLLGVESELKNVGVVRVEVGAAQLKAGRLRVALEYAVDEVAEELVETFTEISNTYECLSATQVYMTTEPKYQ